MGFIDDLKSGRPGLKLMVPAEWKVHEEHPRRAVFQDPERRVGWHVVLAPVMLDLRPEFEEALRGDVERHARHAFTEQYAQIQLPPEAAAKRLPARTQDPAWPGWSPVITLERTQLGGAPALFILRRLAYEPALEVVLATVLVPLAGGLCEITAFSRTGEPGHRESMLLNLALQQHPGKRPDEVARLLGQAFLDDPKHDDQFPSSPLTLVRRAARWLLGEPGLVEVTTPLKAPPPGPLELTGAECTIEPPPRYLPITAQGLGVPPGMNVLTRVLLDATDNPRVLDVWLLPEPVLTGEGRQDQLLTLARRQAAEWERQGATELEVEVTALPAEGEQLRARGAVRMRLGPSRAQSVSRWIGEPDGRVYRIALGAPAYVPREELEAEADSVLRSFRRRPRQQRQGWLTSDLRLRPPKPAKAD